MQRALASLVILQLLFAAVELTPSRSATCCCRKMCSMKRACGSSCSMDRQVPRSSRLDTPGVAPPTSTALALFPIAGFFQLAPPSAFVPAFDPETPPPRL
ncbi:MAG: hypothetical protein ACXV5L_03250 [Thermoanaerobaculia bacterium]